MGSISGMVRAYLDTDVVLRPALARGTLNYRRAARWLIDVQGWDASEEAVVSAIRRHGRKLDGDGIASGYRLLQAASTWTRDGTQRLEETPWQSARRATELGLALDLDGPANGFALSILLHNLAHRNITVLGVATSQAGHAVLVPCSHTERAREVVGSLCRGDGR